MAWWQTILLAVYCLALALLTLYSFHRYIIVRLYLRSRGRLPELPAQFPELPLVTVQLPLYNEYYVAERLIRAVASMDYPKDRFEIQVLDDSTDGTVQLTQNCVERLRGEGFQIRLLQRVDRTGYKAGALAEGLDQAIGEFVAVFDADFVPAPDFLRRTIHQFTDPGIGMVQTRWGHLNRDYSLLTKVQAIMLDGHFVVEHAARNRSGLFFNFNGTSGVWRRSCIAEAGGWQHDTLTEDLDLSYRAQLAGWRFVYLDDVVSPAEIPVEMNAFKAQQFRWAKGSMQTAKKLLLPVLRADLPWKVKLEAVVHLTSNLSYLLMALVSVLIFPALLSRQDLGWYRIFIVDLPLFVGSTMAVSRFYLHSQKAVYADWRSRIKYLPFVLAIGMGISISNMRAVLEAILGHKTEFLRTPKYSVEQSSDMWVGKAYSVRRNFLPFLELAVASQLAVAVVFCIATGIYFPVPFVFLFAFGFTYVGWQSLFQGGLIRRRPAAIASEPVAAD
jgi:cellulose synthase/poly-beta-1,6-N-acetylglucosamine synthase-like glycosyltransferase